MCGYSKVAMVTINKENVRRTARSSTETQPAPPSVHLQTSAGKKQAYLQAYCNRWVIGCGDTYSELLLQYVLKGDIKSVVCFREYVMFVLQKKNDLVAL